MSMSQRAKDKLKKDIKKMLDATEKVYQNMTAKADSGKPLRDQELRFLSAYPDMVKSLHDKLADEKTEETLPPGKLSEYIERLWKLKEIGSLDQVIEATGYYRCSTCGELHKVGEECIYIQYQEIKGLDKEDIEVQRAGFSQQAEAEEEDEDSDGEE